MKRKLLSVRLSQRFLVIVVVPLVGVLLLLMASGLGFVFLNQSLFQQSGMPGKQMPAEATATATTAEQQYQQVLGSLPLIDDSLRGGPKEQLSCQDHLLRGNYSYLGDGLHVDIPGASPTGGPVGNVGCVFMGTHVQFRDVVYQVQMSIRQGEGGLCVRTTADLATGDRFLITTAGQYTLTSLLTSQVLARGTSPTIGQSVLLTVVARGKEISLFVDKQYVLTTSDPSSSEGWLGVCAGNQAASLLFTHATIWRI